MSPPPPPQVMQPLTTQPRETLLPVGVVVEREEAVGVMVEEVMEGVVDVMVGDVAEAVEVVEDVVVVAEENNSID